MNDGPGAYGEVWADFLDEWTGLTASAPPPLFSERVEEWAGEGRILELGIGTGFLSIPLAERGLHIEGLDGSARMLEVLRTKPAAAGIVTHLADFADFDLAAAYDLILSCSSSLFCLPDANAQTRCFASAARHLTPDGRFVVDTYVPDDRWFTDDRLHFIQAEGDGWRMHWDAHRDRVTQTVQVVRRFERNGEDDRLFPHVERYCSPGELDLMARLAGLELDARWADWGSSPYTGEGHAISIYRLAPTQ